MPRFLNDTFTNSNGTALTAHSGETGHTWTNAQNFLLTTVAIQSNAVRSGGLNRLGYASGVPLGPDYEVTGVFTAHATSGSGDWGVLARVQVGLQQWYSFTWNGSGFRLFRSASSAIGTTLAQTLTAGEQYRLTLSVVGSSLAGRVQRVSDSQWLNSSGTWQSTQVDCRTATDTNVTGTGRAGLWLSVSDGSTTGMSCDSVTADDIVPTLVSGTATTTGTTATTASVQVGAASGGTAPYTYQWHRSTISGFTPGPGTIVSGATSLTLTDTGLTGGVTYYYRCVVTDSAAATATSNQTIATTAASLTAGTASTVSVGSTIATVTCLAASGGTSPYTYQWYRSTTSGFTPGAGSLISGATALTFNDTGLTNGTTYFYRCRATDAAASTADSNETSATPVAANDFAVDNANIFWSPYNWRFSGSTFAETINAGAYFKTRFSGASCTLLLDNSTLSGLSSGQYPALLWSVNGGTFQRSLLTAGQTTLSLATGLGAGPHTLELFVVAAWYATARWTTERIRFTGLRLASGGTLSAPTLRPGRMIVYGDSNGEGYESLGTGVGITNQDATVVYGQLIARAMDCEVGIVAFASQGYNATGSGGVPNLLNSWNLFSSGQSRLVSGAFSPAPDWIVSCHGQNDGSSPAATVTSLIGAWRTAAPSAKIAICSPSTLTQATAIASGVSAAGDANAKWIATNETLYIVGGAYVNSNHLTGLRGHPRYAAALLGAMNVAFNATGTYTAASNVRLGTDRGDGVTGTLAVPTASQVLNGVAVDGTVGNVVIPSQNNVLSPVAFGPANALTGAVSLPHPVNVRSGVNYGPLNVNVGRLALPSASQVLSGVGFGTDATEATGTVVLPLASNVKKSVTFGAGSSTIGTCAVPSASEVLVGVEVDATVGGVVLPSVGDVEEGVTFGPYSSLTGTLVVGGSYTAASNVRFGTDRGDGVTGTLRVPNASQVLSGVLVDATTGNVTLPSTSQVQSGVSYGAFGTQFVGTLTGTGVVSFLLPLVSASRSVGVNINLFNGEQLDVSLTLLDSIGAGVLLSGIPVEVIIENADGSDIVVIPDSQITKSSNVARFTIPPSVAADSTDKKWSLRKVADGLVLVKGYIHINYAAEVTS